MEIIRIHTIESPNQPKEREDFKICSVAFDQPEDVDEPIHSDVYNIIWIKKGSGTYTIDFSTYQFSSGMMFFLTPGQMYRVESEEIVEGTRLAFNENFYCVDTFGTKASCDGILFNNPYQHPYITLNPAQYRHFEELSEQILAEFDAPGLAHEELVHSYLQQFLIYATRIKDQQSDFEETEADSEETEFMTQFHNLIEQNYRSKHAVAEYADMLHMAPKSLHRKVKRLTGETVSQIIQNRLTLEAKRLLYHTDMTVKQIGYELGFDDPTYFSRFFKKQTGQSATKFQEEFHGS